MSAPTNSNSALKPTWPATAKRGRTKIVKPKDEEYDNGQDEIPADTRQKCHRDPIANLKGEETPLAVSPYIKKEVLDKAKETGELYLYKLESNVKSKDEDAEEYSVEVPETDKARNYITSSARQHVPAAAD
ncbi:hypothetical protein J1614_007025 [Plenodomus biglobosus]|nr:hypothetical protein J1614_007025 [Plenodomus biglobosus]